MSEEREDIADDDGTPARKVWSTPALTAVAAEDAAVGSGTGGDFGIYS